MKASVLVIDDDPTARELLTGYLEQDGFDVVTAATGVEGLKLAKELRPFAITLDIIMPDLDGWTVLAALKGDPELAKTPVVLVTIVDEKHHGIALGAVGHLTKPIERSRLLDVLAKWRSSARCTRVLVVEDDSDQRAIMAAALGGPEWSVIEAVNGCEALQRLRGQLPDVMVLDLMMPEMDGFELIAELQANPAWRHIPVLVVTALDLAESDRQRLNVGVARIFSKASFSAEDLVQQIQAVLPNSSSHDAAQRKIAS